MRKSTIVAIVMAFILSSISICFAQASDDQTGKMGKMMSDQGMMGHQKKSDQGMMGRDQMGNGMMSRDQMGKGMMSKSMVATQDGGVVVMIGNRLYKFDQNLNLKKETEISVDYEGLKSMMMKMQKMGMGMDQEASGASEMSPSEDAE
jgi:hypothetical protein